MKKIALAVCTIFMSCLLLSSCSQKSVRLSILKKDIKKNPTSAKAHNDLAYFYDENGEHENAIDEYEKSLELRPGDFLATNNMGKSYFSLGEYEKAREIFTGLAEKRPEDSLVHNNLAMAYHKLEMYPEAVKYYKKALELNPKNKNAIDGFGILKEELKAKKIRLEDLNVSGEDEGKSDTGEEEEGSKEETAK